MPITCRPHTRLGVEVLCCSVSYYKSENRVAGKESKKKGIEWKKKKHATRELDAKKKRKSEIFKTQTTAEYPRSSYYYYAKLLDTICLVRNS